METPRRPDLYMGPPCIPDRPDIAIWQLKEVLSPWALERLHSAGQHYLRCGVRENRTGKIRRVVKYTIGSRGNGIWIHYHPDDSKWGPDYRTVFEGGGRAWHRAERQYREAQERRCSLHG